VRVGVRVGGDKIRNAGGGREKFCKTGHMPTLLVITAKGQPDVATRWVNSSFRDGEGRGRTGAGMSYCVVSSCVYADEEAQRIEVVEIGVVRGAQGTRQVLPRRSLGSKFVQNGFQDQPPSIIITTGQHNLM
jgi:hypothetical protein